MRKSKNRYFYHIFVSPGNAPGAITLNVVWMKREFDAHKLSRSMYPSIFNNVPVIRTATAKKSPFSRTAAHIFVSSGDAPATITQCVAWMEKQFNACQSTCSMYLSILNSFRVIRCLNQCVVQKLLFLPHFYFPWGRPWGNHTKCCMDKKRIWCSQIVSQHVPIYLQQCSSYSNRNCKKIAIFTYRSPHYCFPWRRPCDYHAICCMDGKTIQCLPKHLQRVPIYLQ